MADKTTFEKITYKASGHGAGSRSVISDEANNEFRVSRPLHSATASNKEQYELACKGAQPQPSSARTFMKILDKLEKYDDKLPWTHTPAGEQKLFNVPKGELLTKLCKDMATSHDL